MSQNKFPVPCGKCPPCRKRRASGWAFRLMQEERYAQTSQFITLTYATEHLPFTKTGQPTLQYRDVQLFFKRLRKAHVNKRGNDKRMETRPTIKYYVVGEYGTHTLRPHYHIILFNARIELIQDAWGLGHVHYGNVTGGSVGYTLKYMCKPGKIPLFYGDKRVPELSKMSKGLGISYLTDAVKKWHKADLHNRICIVLEDGKRIAMPRYYKKRIYTEFEMKIIAYYAKIDSEVREEKEWAEMLEKYGDKASAKQAEFHKDAFDKMYKNALVGRDKI